MRHVLFSHGFRPFFLGGALWAAATMLFWAALLTGHITFETPYGVVVWHSHALLFGYGSAIVAGFLLTAIPNWTGRPPVGGPVLFVLFAVWLSGRVAVLLAGTVGLVAAAIVDSLFLLGMSAVVFREIVAGRNRRNLTVAVIVLLYCLTNIAFHLELIQSGYPFHATKAAVSVLVILIMLIGGRIIPGFTRNWLTAQGARALPAPFSAFDRLALGVAVSALAIWTVFPWWRLTGWTLLLAALIQAVRLARWSGHRTFREPLVLILHVGYAFVPLGFAAVGGAILWPYAVPVSGSLHAWTTGAIGVMTLAVMTRASRGHSGRPLTAPASTQFIYLLVLLSAIARLAAALLPESAFPLLVFSSLAWAAAFSAFVIFYGPMLLESRGED